MGEENKDQGKGVDVGEIVAKVNESLSAQLGPIKGQIAVLESKIESKGKETPASNKGENNDDEFKFVGEDLDDDDPITKKDLKKVVEMVADKTAKIADSKARETVNEVIVERNTKVSRDRQALKDFPMIDDNRDEYDEKFLTEVDQEMAGRIQRGRAKNDPDLLYDAAAAVKNRWVDQGKLAPRHLADEERRRLNNQEDNFDARGGNGRQGGKWTPNDYQVNLAGSFGMSKERLLQIRDKYMKN